MKEQPAEEWQPLEETVSKDIFKAEVATWAQKIGVEPTQLHVRPMTRKWGSVSTAGRVTFDVALLTQPAAFRREVIVHELLHLKIPNHGKLFRALLKAYLGEASSRRLTLPRSAWDLPRQVPLFVGNGFGFAQ